MNTKNEQVTIIKNLFQNPVNVYSRAQILSKPCHAPNERGIYAWYFRNFPDIIPSKDCVKYENLTLLYAGISPNRVESRQNLRRRLKTHFRGNASGSTLRLTLGCLLSEQLGIELRRRGNGGRMHFGIGEQNLSQWMDENAFVMWFICEEPWRIETELLRELSLPLNLQHNQHHAFHPDLTAIRSNAKEMARNLPIN